MSPDAVSATKIYIVSAEAETGKSAVALGVLSLLTATGGGDKHALVIEHQLRPLFGFFEAVTLPTGVYASTADFTEGQPAALPLLARIDRAVAQFTPWLRRPVTANAA